MVETQRNDAELLEAYARTGEQEAFALVVRRHIDVVHGTARRMLRDEQLAEDVTQAVFLLLARRAGRLGSISIGAWLYLATTYTVRNMQRAERRRREREQAVASERAVCNARGRGGDVDVDAALGRLRPWERDVLVLRYLQSMSVPEVAAGLGISEMAAGKRLVRAMASLRRTLGVEETAAAGALAIAGRASDGLADAVVQMVGGNAAPAEISGLAKATAKGLIMLRLLGYARIAAGVAIPAALGVAALAALPATKEARATTRPVETAAAPSGDIMAIDSTMSLWWIDPASKYRVENGELVVHNPTAQAGAFHGWIGGPSWENHHVALEFLVERDTSPAQPRPGAYDFNIQIAPHNSAMFFQLMGRACNICVMTPEVNGGEFTHISDKPAPPVALGRWYRLKVISEDRHITMVLDGKVLNEADIPASTRGMLGLLVNFASDAVVRIRNMQVTLLDPNEQQMAEEMRNAKENWMREAERLRQAGKPVPEEPWKDAP